MTQSQHTEYQKIIHNTSFIDFKLPSGTLWASKITFDYCSNKLFERIPELKNHLPSFDQYRELFSTLSCKNFDNQVTFENNKNSITFKLLGYEDLVKGSYYLQRTYTVPTGYYWIAENKVIRFLFGRFQDIKISAGWEFTEYYSGSALSLWLVNKPKTLLYVD